MCVSIECGTRCYAQVIAADTIRGRGYHQHRTVAAGLPKLEVGGRTGGHDVDSTTQATYPDDSTIEIVNPDHTIARSRAE